MAAHAASDLVVVGAGPAGCAAAIWAARAGLAVRLLDRPDPRAERPGETLLPGSEPLLAQLGVEEAVRAAGFPRPYGHWVEWDGPRRFEPYGGDGGGPWRGFQAWRATLDGILREGARRSGAEVVAVRSARPLVEDGAVVGVSAEGGDWRAPVVVDAAGGRHWLARHLGLAVESASPRLLAGYAYLRGETADDDAPTIAADASGWSWRARVGDGIHQWVRLRLDGRLDRGYRPASLAALRPLGGVRGADVTWRHVPAAAGSGYYAVGDAAAVLDPLSAHGVLKAIMSGMLAADLAVRTHRGALSAVAAAEGYRRWSAEWFARDVRRLRELYASLPSPPAWSRATASAG